jgi:acetyl esterase/lipase
MDWMTRIYARFIAGLAISLLLATAMASLDGTIAQAGPLRALLAKRLAKRLEADKASGGRDLAYGADPLQHLRVWAPADGTQGTPAPLILFVHGGGWRMGSAENATGKAKTSHYPQLGYAFASIDYRLVPAARVEDQAADVAAALAWIVGHAGELHVDPRRIVIMGHSAGAHLVALVGTDPRYLEAAGLSEQALAGVVPIDGAAYDVPAQMASVAQYPRAGQFFGQMFGQAFGDDPARQRALSPTLQAAAPNAPAFLILHVQRPDGIAQSKALAAALRKAGTPVQIASFPGTGLKGHMTINRSLGDLDYPATKVVDDWLKARFSE